MRTKIQDVVVGCWFVALGACYRFLMRIGVLPLAADPLTPFEFEEEK